MQAKRIIAAIFAVVITMGIVALLGRRPAVKESGANAEQAVEVSQPAQPVAVVRVNKSPGAGGTLQEPGPIAKELRPSESVMAETTNKLERLERLRERFKVLAAGEPKQALIAAREIKDEAEREVALMTLVSTWRQGELSAPRDRARMIATFGLEGGLGLELVKDPVLAGLWADELLEGESRNTLLTEIGMELVKTNSAAALAMVDQIGDRDGGAQSQAQRKKFMTEVLAAWAANDTDAALDWASQISDPAQQNDAINAIRTTAPVGIGTQLAMRDGYPVITGLLPGAPAEANGQIHSGDRIVAIAQANGSFMDTSSMSLQDIVQAVRGAPGTVIQLQVNSADSAPESAPRTVTIVRDQIRFKKGQSN